MSQRSVTNLDNRIEHYRQAIFENVDLMPATQRAYIRIVTRAIVEGIDLSDAFAVAGYAKTLPRATAYALRGALLTYAQHMTLVLESQVTPGSYQTTAAAIMRLNAVPHAVKPVKANKGSKAHIWLERSEVAHLLDSPNVDNVSGLRDWIVLSFLVGAGLRREESTQLTWGDLIAQGRRYVIQVKGKGNKYRLVPVAKRMMPRLRRWQAATGDNGAIVRRVRKGDKLTDSGIAVATVNRIVSRYGADIGQPKLQPHDLRRTYAQIGLDNGIPIEQISTLLGHTSITTTQRYLNIGLNLDESIGDFVPF